MIREMRRVELKPAASDQEACRKPVSEQKERSDHELVGYLTQRASISEL